MSPVVLQTERLRLSVLPELGACVAGLELRQGDFWLPILRPMSLAAVVANSSPESSSYLLAPYSNRIAEGRFGFGGQAYALQSNWPDGQTIHGEVHGRPWQHRLQDGVLHCRFDSATHGHPNFPFAYSVELRFGFVGESALEVAATLTNQDTRPMPAGLGHHPYFMRHLAGHEATLRFSAAAVYLTDSSCIPTQPAVPLPTDFDFSQGKPLGKSQFDHVFAGWNGQLWLDWERCGLHLQASELFSHLVLFTAPDGSVALEPVSHATNGFNLLEQGWPQTGVRVLGPGESLRGSLSLMVSA